MSEADVFTESTPGVREAWAGADAILKAFAALPDTVRKVVIMDMLEDPSEVLSGLAEALLPPRSYKEPRDRAERVAHALYFGAWLGDGREIVQRLGDAEPWATVKLAVWEVAHAHDVGAFPWRRNNVVGLPRPEAPGVRK